MASQWQSNTHLNCWKWNNNTKSCHIHPLVRILSAGFLVLSPTFLPLCLSMCWVSYSFLTSNISTMILTFAERVIIEESIALNSIEFSPLQLPCWFLKPLGLPLLGTPHFLELVWWALESWVHCSGKWNIQEVSWILRILLVTCPTVTTFWNWGSLADEMCNPQGSWWRYQIFCILITIGLEGQLCLY